jgi:hypothetical protein
MIEWTEQDLIDRGYHRAIIDGLETWVRDDVRGDDVDVSRAFATTTETTPQATTAKSEGIKPIRGTSGRKNKYGAVRTYSELCKRTFDSKAEARRGEELRYRELAGEISDLVYQVGFELSTVPRVTITMDFRYKDAGVVIYEDVKGVMTRDFRTKLAWLKEKTGIEVRIVK